MIQINPIELITPKGFDQAFFRLCNSPEFKTQEQAYEYLEEVYITKFKMRRYASYNSFRIAKMKRY